MRAYRINLIGTNNSYLITEKQKPTLQAVVERRNERYVKIGDDLIQTASVKSITATNVDVECCPDYFIKQVELEKKNQPEPTMPGYTKLPTEWIILDLEGKILATDISRSTIDRIARSLLARGDVEEDETLRFLVAKCHYTVGSDDQKQYYAKLNQIMEAYRCIPYAELPSHLVVRQVYKYGVRQWNEKAN